MSVGQITVPGGSGGVQVDKTTIPQRNAVGAAGVSDSAAPADHVHPGAFWGAEDHGLKAWAFDPAIMGGAVIPAAGTLTMARLRMAKAGSISTVHFYVTAAGVTLTLNQCFVLVYNATTRALIGQSAEQSTALQSSGLKSVALASSAALNAGDEIMAGLYWNGGTGPTIARGVSAPLTALISLNLLRFVTSNVGLTTTPPATCNSFSAYGSSIWMAVS